jgi:hypothetical protein
MRGTLSRTSWPQTRRQPCDIGCYRIRLQAVDPSNRGPVLASRIVQHRDSVGGFKEVGELRDVPGIGEKTFQALAELVSL